MSTPARLAITDDMTIYNALAQKQQLVAALEGTTDLELDLSQVNALDTAGLQLLILTKREANQSGKNISIVAHSPAVRQTIDFCNMASFFAEQAIIAIHEQV